LAGGWAKWAKITTHNQFGRQGKSPTTNGVFGLKKPQIRIVEIANFL
jgi:hypothetical protein